MEISQRQSHTHYLSEAADGAVSLMSGIDRSIDNARESIETLDRLKSERRTAKA